MLDAILCNVAAASFALLWALWLRPRPLALAPLMVALLHILVIQTWVLVTSVLMAVDRPIWRIIAVVLIIAVAIVAFIFHNTFTDEWEHWRCRARRAWFALRWPARTGLFGCMVAMTGWVAAAGYLVGPHLPDVITYHLVPPAGWVAHGGIEQTDWIDSRAWWPQGHGLLAAWWMLPFQLLRAAVWAELHWLVVIWAAAWALARRLGASVRTAALAVMLVAAVPIIWAQAVSGINDLAIAALALAALAILAGRKVDGRHLALAGLVLLMGLGIKPTMLSIAPVLIALACYQWRRARSQPRPHADRYRRLAIIRALIVALLIGGYWYARNTVVWDNPFYPANVQIGDNELLAGHPDVVERSAQLSFSNLGQNLRNLATDRMWDRTPLKSAYADNATGFGTLAVTAGLLALVGAMIAIPRARALIIATAAIGLLLAAGLKPDTWNGRFFNLVPLVLVVCIAVITPRLRHSAVLIAWVVILAAAAGWSLKSGVESTLPARVRFQWREQGIKPVELNYTKYAHLVMSSRALPPTDTLVVVSDGRIGPFALLHGDRLQRRLIYARNVPTPEEIQQWRAQGVRWVCFIARLSELPQADFVARQLGLQFRDMGIYEIPE